MPSSLTYTGDASGDVEVQGLADAPAAAPSQKIKAFFNAVIDAILAKVKADETDGSNVVVSYDQDARTVSVSDIDGVAGGNETYTAVADGSGSATWSAAGADNLGVLTPQKPKKNFGTLILDAMKESDDNLSGSVNLGTGEVQITGATSGMTETYTPDEYVAPNYVPGEAPAAGDFWE